MMTYPEIFSKLTYETAIIIFLKKNGEIRTMLGTRNLNTVSLEYGFQGQVLGGHDRRCNISNGNIAVYDMIVGDARSFNIERLVDIQFLGVLNTKDEYNAALKKYVDFKTEYDKTKPQCIDMSMV